MDRWIDRYQDAITRSVHGIKKLPFDCLHNLPAHGSGTHSSSDTAGPRAYVGLGRTMVPSIWLSNGCYGDAAPWLVKKGT